MIWNWWVVKSLLALSLSVCHFVAWTVFRCVRWVGRSVDRLVTFSNFHCVSVSLPLQSVRGPREVINRPKAMTNSFQTSIFPNCILSAFIFPKCIFPNCIFHFFYFFIWWPIQTSIFPNCIFPIFIFPNCIFHFFISSSGGQNWTSIHVLVNWRICPCKYAENMKIFRCLKLGLL